VVAVGHEGQIDAIQLPGMFAEMVSERSPVPVASLGTIRRHLDPNDPAKDHPWLGDYQMAVNDGDGRSAVDILRRNDAAVLHDTRAKAVDAMVDEWQSWRGRYEIERTAMIVHGSNADVDDVNRLAQERRIDAGELRGESTPAPVGGYRFYCNDVVVLTQAAYRPSDRAPQVMNGQIGIVQGIDPERGLVTVCIKEPGLDAREVTFDVSEMGGTVPRGQAKLPLLKLAYARHPNPMQGATLSAVATLGGHWSQGKEATYVADTRGRFILKVFLSRDAYGSGVREEICWKRFAEQITTVRSRSASIASPVVPDGRFTFARSEVAKVTARDARDHERTDIPALVEVADPLHRYEHLFGHERAGALRARAAELQPTFAGADDAWLQAVHGGARGPLTHLTSPEGRDLRAGARETLEIEQERLGAVDRCNTALAKRDELRTRADALSGFGKRHERERLLEAAEIHRRIAYRERAELKRLGLAEGALRDGGRHLDDWLATNGERVARSVAVKREMATRREMMLAVEVERTLEDAPERLTSVIGPAPDRRAPERGDWEQAGRTLEGHRLRRELAERDDLPSPELDARERRELGHRIHRLRKAQGLDDLELDREIPDYGMD
jgi:hypothetical protein